jgi:tetratricopeptide (TPR) repeat protein
MPAGGGADLPMPVGGGADLPMPTGGGAGLPMPATRKAVKAPQQDDLSDFGDLPLPVTSGGFGDLPSPKNAGEIDLPTVGSASGKSARQITGAALGFGEPDLPVVPPKVSPAPAAGGFGDGFGELDLPSAADAGLPVVSSGNANLPAVADPLGNLPTTADPLGNLPATADPFGNLPTTAEPQQNLPSSIELGQQLPSPLDLDQQLPAGSSADDLFGAPPQRGGLFPDGMPPAPPPSTAPAPAGFGTVPPAGSGLSAPPLGAPASGDLFGSMPPGPSGPTPGSLSGDAFGSLPPEAPASDPEVTRQAGGGVSFGEVNLGDDGGGDVPSEIGGQLGSVAKPSAFGERDLPGGGDDDMEFGAIPQEEEGGAGDAVGETGIGTQMAEAPQAQGQPVALPAKKSKAVKILLVVLLVLLVSGIALSATPFGAFGINLISDTVNAGSYQTRLEETVESSRSKFAKDTSDQASEALKEADEIVSDAPRFAPIAAYAAFLGYQSEVRFGLNSAVHAHAGAQLANAAKDGKDARYLSLARAAQAAASGEVAKARQSVQALARRDTNNIDVAVLEGEVELLAKEYKTALAAWERAAKIEKSARTSFGLARTYLGLGDADKARVFAEQAIEQTKSHVGARILLARLFVTENKLDKSGELLTEIVGPKEKPAIRAAASKAELVKAYTLLGQIHLGRSRMSASEGSFAEALKLDPKDSDALCGFGEVLYREGRYAEALARFEAGIQANAESVPAKIGAAKTKIALERLQEAKEVLRKLREARPADPVVAFWLAKVEEALGNKPEVEKILVDAIGRDPKGKEAIDLYVALAQFLAAQGRMPEADAKLAEARRKLPDSPAIHKALGSVALAAGRLNEARNEFDIALQRDSTDLSSLFNLGVTLRRMGRFEDAQERFDKVSTIDKNYPGLALERGVLFEASGQAQRALEMYQEALSKAPNDPDLMLRVGSAEVAAGHASQAEEILRKVLRARPNSAEANHYLGRAQLLKGANLAEALRFLKRASEIDPNRAEYWLYIGWAANDAGQPGTAEKALEKALELDQSLADAYWQRGILLRRQGAVRDAEKDLEKALELKPSRFEAYATLAECYEDLSRWEAAATAWKRAIEADGNRPFWRYKLGRLYYNARKRPAAGEELKRAVQLAAKESRPAWLWEAYLMLAEVSRSGGRRAEAIEYYREYLKLAPPDSPFRADAIKQLSALGAPFDER